MLQKLLDLYRSLKTHEEKNEFWCEINNLNIEFLSNLYESACQHEIDVNYKIDNMVKESYDSYKPDSGLPVKEYIKLQQSFIWPIFFQSPYIVGKSKIEREWIYEIFKDWNANNYVIEYCKKLDEKFKDLL